MRLSDHQLADPEASLYAGLATVVMVQQLASNDGLDLLSPFQLLFVATDALHNIVSGIEGLPPAETQLASAWLDTVAAVIESDGVQNILDTVVDVLDPILPDPQPLVVQLPDPQPPVVQTSLAPHDWLLL